MSIEQDGGFKSEEEAQAAAEFNNSEKPDPNLKQDLDSGARRYEGDLRDSEQRALLSVKEIESCMLGYGEADLALQKLYGLAGEIASSLAASENAKSSANEFMDSIGRFRGGEMRNFLDQLSRENVQEWRNREHALDELEHAEWRDVPAEAESQIDKQPTN